MWISLKLALFLGAQLAKADETKPAFFLPRPLGVISMSNMRFDPAFQGDGTDTVNPDGSFYGSNAWFRVHGMPFAAVYISLPRGGVYMRHRSGNGKRAQIKIYNFKSLPAEGKTFRLSFVGDKNIFVGATRDKIQKQQKAGFYSGTFLLTVSYQ